MSAAETIQKAIEKLERLKADSAPGNWRHWPEAGQVEIFSDHVRPESPSSEFVVIPSVRPRNGWTDRIYEDNYEPTAELIVTLHRTIDAQLAILQTAFNTRGIERKWDSLVYTDNALALAEAILGGAE